MGPASQVRTAQHMSVAGLLLYVQRVLQGRGAPSLKGRTETRGMPSCRSYRTIAEQNMSMSSITTPRLPGKTASQCLYSSIPVSLAAKWATYAIFQHIVHRARRSNSTLAGAVGRLPRRGYILGTVQLPGCTASRYDALQSTPVLPCVALYRAAPRAQADEHLANAPALFISVERP